MKLILCALLLCAACTAVMNHNFPPDDTEIAAEGKRCLQPSDCPGRLECVFRVFHFEGHQIAGLFCEFPENGAPLQ